MDYIPLFALETWILLITFICLFIMYGKGTHGIFEKLGIPGSKPVMYFGTIGKHNRVYYLADHECAQKYGKVWGMYECRKPILAVKDPDMLKTILVKECFTHFTIRRNLRLNGDLYDSVNFAEDDHWRWIRNNVSPFFTTGHIKQLFGLMKQQSSKLRSSLEPKAQNEEVISLFWPLQHEHIHGLLSRHGNGVKAAATHEALMQMEYLDCVINECLRLYPSVARLERTAKKTVKISGITIPKNMTVLVPIYALHHDPEHWPEPEEFNPDRFSKQNKGKIQPYTYLPFGVGPRNCLGMRLSLVIVKLALVEVLRKYSFLVCKETEIPFEMDPHFLVGPKNPIKLRVVRR